MLDESLPEGWKLRWAIDHTQPCRCMSDPDWSPDDPGTVSCVDGCIPFHDVSFEFEVAHLDDGESVNQDEIMAVLKAKPWRRHGRE